MSTLQKVKAYFGMIPLDNLDEHYSEEHHSGEYGASYGDHHFEYQDDRGHYEDYDRDYDRGAAGQKYPRSDYASDYSQTNSSSFSSAPTTRLEPLRPNNRDKSYGAASSRRYMEGDLALDVHKNYYEEPHPTGQIITLKPRDYSEARIVGESFRDGSPVIMDLVAMDNADAKRLVDFAAGLAFALRGTFDKVSTKVFLLSPQGIEVSAEDRKKLVETGFYARGI